jgi:hypothetical protein
MRQPLKAPRRRLSESRMRENLTSGSKWQGMETRHGDGTEALSQETESNGSATPKSRRHPLTLPIISHAGIRAGPAGQLTVLPQSHFSTDPTTTAIGFLPALAPVWVD